MDHEQVLDRVRKLLRLADHNSNPNEAAAAAAAAQRLMAAHGLDAAVLAAAHEDEDRDGEEPITDDHPALHRAQRKSPWRGWLASAVARANGAYCYWHGGSLRLVGRRSEVALASALYGWIEAQIERLAREALAAPEHRAQIAYQGARVWGGSFRRGAVRAVAEALREAKAAAERDARERHGERAEAGIVLVRERSEAVERWVREHMKLGAGSPSQARASLSGASAGYAAGRTIDVRGRAMGGAAGPSSRLLLGGGT